MLLAALLSLSFNFTAAASDACDHAYELQSRSTTRPASVLAVELGRPTPVQDLLNNLNAISNHVESQLAQGCADEVDFRSSHISTKLRQKNGDTITLSREVDGEPGDLFASYDGPNGTTDYQLTPNYFGANCTFTLRITHRNHTSICEYAPKQNILATLAEQQPSLENDLPTTPLGYQTERYEVIIKPSSAGEASVR